MPTFGAITQSQTYRLELNSTSTSTVKGSVTVEGPATLDDGTVLEG